MTVYIWIYPTRLAKRLQDHVAVRGALERALGYKSSSIEITNRASILKDNHDYYVVAAMTGKPSCPRKGKSEPDGDIGMNVPHYGISLQEWRVVNNELERTIIKT